MKIVDVYGIEMTSIEEMKFSQYLDKSDLPAMNTLTKEERLETAKKWLDNHRINNKK